MKRSSDPSSRVPTGIPGLDPVLGGGLVLPGMYMLEGPPGAGKTILSAQLGFRLARAGHKAIYLSLIAESHGKLLQNLRGFEFFDDKLVPERFVLMSGYQELKSAGLAGLLQFIAQALAEHRPALLVIDGYSSLHMLAPRPSATAEFVYELNTLITTAKCLCVLIAPQENGHWAEKNLVDGLIELYRQPSGMRSVRELEVHKMRAAAQIEGRHAFLIDSSGIRVFPRLEASVPFRHTPPVYEDERAAFGVPGLDGMLYGGVLRGSVTCVSGPPGAGKTIACLHFLNEGARHGEPGLYFGFYEAPTHLLAKARNLGMKLEEAYQAGTFAVVWQPALECGLDQLAAQLLEDVQRRQVRRVVIDGLEGFVQSAIRPERISTFFNALVGELRRLHATTLYTEESTLFALPAGASTLSSPAIVGNHIVLGYVQHEAHMRRTIAVLKQRQSAHDQDLRECWIEDKGLRVAPDSGSAQAFLAGS